jgi:hypothetical protein
MSNRYDKMEDYVSSIFNVFQLVNKKAEQQQDKRMKIIALVIFNYTRFMAKEYNVDLKTVDQSDTINLIPIFEYVASNDVELYDFKTININDIDMSSKQDLERYVLTHVYYITQGNYTDRKEK